MFGNQGRRDDPAFEMKQAVPFFKLGLMLAGAFFVLLLLGLFFVRITRIEAGHVGVEINLAGKQRGASEIPVRTGWVSAEHADHRVSDLRASGEMDEGRERRASDE